MQKTILILLSTAAMFSLAAADDFHNPLNPPSLIDDKLNNAAKQSQKQSGKSGPAVSDDTFIFPGGPFQCRPPSGWERRIEAEERRAAFLLPAPQDAGARDVDITVALYPAGERYASIEDFLEANDGEKARAARVAGREGRRYERTVESDDQHLGTVRMRQAYVLVPVKKGFFVLALSVRDRGKGRAYQRFLPAFERLLKSFQPAEDPFAAPKAND